VPAEGEAGPTDDAATTEDGSEPAAEDRAESEPADDESAQESVDDEAAVEDDADVVDDDDVADDDRDEVVVDLFARLRADAARRGAEDAPEPRSTATATLVGDLDDGASAGSEDDRAGADLRSNAGDGAADAGGDDEPNPFRRRDAELTPLIVASAKKLKRALADEQNAVLETLRHDEAVADVDALIPAVDDHVARYVDAARDELLAAANAGARAGTSGSVTKLRKASGEAAVGAAAAVVGEWLVGPLRERLERGVADGGGDNAAVSRRVRSLYREWKTQHIDEQLDDVLRMAFGRGAFEAVKTGTPLVWSIDAEHPACPDCDDNGLAGPVAAGEEFPTGHLHAPAHPGCRCLLLQPDS
jgi:hypothetical protein